MTLNVTALPESAGALPALRLGQPLPVSAAGVNDPAAIARQQMVIAAPAPALIAAYSTHIPPAPKLVVRNPVSSPLAAQFIAQNPGASADELAVFEAQATPAQTPTPQATADDDFFASIRIARGGAEMAPIAAATKQAAGVKQAPAANVPDGKAEAAAAESTNALRSGIGQIAASLPALFAQFTRPASFAKARGLNAYQIALNRNVGNKKSESPAAL